MVEADHDQVEVVSIGDLQDPDERRQWVNSAATLLSSEWPLYRPQLRRRHLSLLVEGGDREGFVMIARRLGSLLGVVKLRAVQRTLHDSIGYLSCLMIDRAHRRRGLGSRLLLEVERRARSSLFVRIYAQTSLRGFFSKLNFTFCPKPDVIQFGSLLSPNQTVHLESILQQRLTQQDIKERSVWMTNAIIEERQMVHRSLELWRDELLQAMTPSSSRQWGIVNGLPFLLQIGPSCGLAAVRMASTATDVELAFFVEQNRCEFVEQADVEQILRNIDGAMLEVVDSTDFLASSSSTSSIERLVEVAHSQRKSKQEPSLLQTAIQLDYSYLGEIFNASHLAQLGRIIAPHSRIELIRGPMTAVELVARVLDGASIVMAYDRSKNNHQAELRNGTRAHWLVVVGVVADEGSAEISVVAQHGMSLHPLVVPADLLLKSNHQLTGPLAHETPYRIWNTGIKLADHFICFYTNP